MRRTESGESVMDFRVPMRLPRPEAALRDVSSARAAFRISAAQALSLVDDDRRDAAVKALKELTVDPVSAVRAQAVTSLGQLCFECVDIQEEMVLLLNDPSPEVRVAVLVYLEETKISDVQARLLELLRDEDERVSCRAALHLASVEDKEGISMLLQHLSHRGPFLDEVIVALVSCLEPRARDPLQILSNRFGLSCELKALVLAGLLRWDETTDLHMRSMLRSRRRRNRMAALEALCRLPCVRMMSELQQISVRAGDTGEASCAIQTLSALYSLDSRSVLSALTVVLSTASGGIRDEVLEMLASLESMENSE